MPPRHDAPPAAFNPAAAGTPEQSWKDLLRASPEWLPDAQPLLVVSPHPDDEVLGAGGLMRLHVAAGHSVTVLSVTDGGGAYPDWPGLGPLRRGELGAALQVLGGGKIKVVHLGVPDGAIEANRAGLLDAITRLVAPRPVIIAPYECDGHPDHDAAGAACRQIAHEYGLTLLRYPVWTWHQGAPSAFAGCRWGRIVLDAATRQAKARAVDCFTSQLHPRGREPILPAHVLDYFARPYEAFLL